VPARDRPTLSYIGGDEWDVTLLLDGSIVRLRVDGVTREILKGIVETNKKVR
jgi:hypothetical protein